MKPQPHFLFLSQRLTKSLLFLVLLSQVVTVAIVAFDVSQPEIYILTQESEEPKPAEEKNAFDYLEESKFIIPDFPLIVFLSDENLKIFHDENLFFEVVNTLDSPPPEVV